METFRVIDIETWQRRDLFRFYQRFASPNYNVSVSLDAALLYRFAKEQGHSFFLLSCYTIARALNSVPEMRQRFLDENTVAEYDVIHPSCPLAREGSDFFVQVLLPYKATFRDFEKTAQPVVDAVRCGKITESDFKEMPNLFCASCVPWFESEGVVVAEYSFNQAEQVITWFKMNDSGKMTISGRFNHAFTDGIHLGRFFSAVQENFSNPEKLF